MNQRIDKMGSRAFARQANEFWSRPEAWPRNMPKYVFFARVIDEMGKSRFPAEWPDDIRQIRRDAHYGTIASAIADHCAAGRLVGAVQDSLGRPLELPEYVWNTREFEEWFAIGQAPLSHAYPPGSWHPLADRPQCWLFIAREGIEALANGATSMQREPATINATTRPSDYASTKKPATVSAMKRTIASAQTFLKRQGFSALTKAEGDQLLEELHGGSREKRRDALEGITISKRRPQGLLANRYKELDDCRRYLAAAD